jgi:hypothetical protein
MAAGDIFAWKMAPLIDPMAGGSVLALPWHARAGDEGHRERRYGDRRPRRRQHLGDSATTCGSIERWSTRRKADGKEDRGEIAAELKPKFPVFTKEELLTDMEYGGTPLSRAVINVNAAFRNLRNAERSLLTAS